MKTTVKKLLKFLPNNQLSNIDINQFAKYLKMPYCRGVSLRDIIFKTVQTNKSYIINLDIVSSLGTHWVADNKRGIISCYFDSYGNFKPPLELP